MRKLKMGLLISAMMVAVAAVGAEKFISFNTQKGYYPLIENGKPATVYIDQKVDSAAIIAAENLSKDFRAVCGEKARIARSADKSTGIIVTTVGSPVADRLIKNKTIAGKDIVGKREKFIITSVKRPCENVDSAVVIVGSDRRGTVYGIYELSEQLGVSPWYWWADVPVEHNSTACFKPGSYTDGEPAVAYRGIFLNDEAPSLTSWVKNHYGTDYGDHRFYADVFELILRLRGNFMWPAMWSWAFYADDDRNSATADRMGVIMGTSHHEPMARNHQEWARNRQKYGAWNYSTNQAVIDDFFRQGVRRMKGTEDIVTIGMRGDGDEAMEEGTNVKLMERIIRKQRDIIAQETGRPAKETPQARALYKEVLDYYDAGMKVPDDVIMLLCDDNWGNVRRLPNEQERKHPGGWGIYYHVDYVGAPRNTKWLNVTPIQGMWEQLALTYDYGVDKLWILNVGDLKPMEYPITLFMDMAWNPHRYDQNTLFEHIRKYCTSAFGADNGEEAARILNAYCKLAGLVTPEMLDKDTYDLESGEWRMISDRWARLEAEALRQYVALPEQYRDAYQQLILFPVQAFGNLYEMYYAQAMNHSLANNNDPAANDWTGRVERCFNRDAELCRYYNKTMSGGKWDGMMSQKHIGYTSWNDDFRQDTMPEVVTVNAGDRNAGGYTVNADGKTAVIEAEHFYSAQAPEGIQWTVYPDMGRTLSGVALTPYTRKPQGASLTYRIRFPERADSVTVRFVLKSTLAFSNPTGHCFSAGFDGAPSVTVNINHDLNERPENIYTVFYPTVARRVIEKQIKLPVTYTSDGFALLTLTPHDPAIVFEKIIVSAGDYKPTYLHLPESPVVRTLLVESTEHRRGPRKKL